MQDKQTLSRRKFLIGMGVLGSGIGACVCGGMTSAGLLWFSSQPRPDLPTLVPASPIPTQSPRFEQPPIISRNSWGALAPNHNASNENGFYSDDNVDGWRIYGDELNTAYQTVVIHHSAFYEDNDINTLLEVQTAHRNQRHWADVGYHFLIGKNGLIYEGRDWHVRGTHVETFNTGSLGICLLGNFMREAPNVNQLNSTLALINWGSERLQLTHIATHRDFNPRTQCPGDNLYPYLEQFASASGLSIGTDGYIAPQDTSACYCCGCQIAT